MKKILSTLLFMTVALSSAAMLVSCSKDDDIIDPKPAFVSEFGYKIVPQEEAKQYFLHEKLHEQITPYFIDLAMQRQDVPHDEWLDLTLRSIQNPMEEWQAYLDSIARVQSDRLRSMGLSLPILKQIELIDMEMETFGGIVAAFTSGTRIYANMKNFSRYEEEEPGMGESILWHEMWHVISRNNPELRKKMFALIGFNVLPDEVEIPAEVKAHILCNPDVERHDSYATFNINGKPTDCMLLLYAEEDKLASFTLLDYLATSKGYWLLALDSVNHKPYCDEKGKWVIYNCTEAEDFDKVMSGGNTYYCDDPEECMADNFAYAMMTDTNCPNQKLLQDIRDLMMSEYLSAGR